MTRNEIETARPSATSRVGLLVVQIAAAIVALFAAVYGMIVTSWAYQGKMGEFFQYYSYVTDESPVLSSREEIWQAFDTVVVSSYAPLVLPRTLAAVSTAIPFIIVLIACVCIFVLARRLRTGRPFSRPAQVGLALLGVVSVVGSVLGPWLDSVVSMRVIEELGLPNNNDPGVTVSDAWVVPTYFTWTDDTNWPLLTMGVVALLVAVLWQQAVRMQKDQEGLV